LTLKVETNLGCKKEINYIQFEFTGRYTNVIILDENFLIIEALHHINEKLNINPIGFFGFGEIYTINNKAKLFNQTITFIGIKEKEAQFISMEDDVKDDTLSVKTNIEIFSAMSYTKLN
jgi:predicted ribosome quality control (RQC) complex YloA/Tae2 family protein